MSINAYDRLAPFIQEYIYKERWYELRDIQVAACEVIFDNDTNLLLASGTASGKTEAAFLPVLTDLYNNPSSSVGVLYISPLKALINDQFERLDGLLEYSDIPVWKWHGDVSQNKKQKLLKRPYGVMQTTPESLEALIMKKSASVITLFSDLRYIIIDEVHYFMDSPRGIQLLSILERIQRLTSIIPRRIGLSATLGNYDDAEAWLSSGTNRKCITPSAGNSKRTLKLFLDHYPLHKDGETILGSDEYFNSLYKVTNKRKCIVFSNSRTQVEYNIAMLKRMDMTNRGTNVYMVHHGNVSTALREYTERTMRESEVPITTGATVTLELGIDIGSLERIVQTGSPFTVSSFVQRLGRCGRKTSISEMCFLFKGFEPSKKDIVHSINWEFLKCIAIIQLYIEERWIEPISTPKLPYSILYHQTMSILYSAGELSPSMLARKVLTLSVFKNISKEDYKVFLNYLLSIKHLEITENNTLIIGLEAEPILNHFEFYSVFTTPKEYSVRYESEEIGTVHQKYPIGEAFCLAGFSWRVKNLDEDSSCIYVEKLEGVSDNMWFCDCYTIIETKIMKRIQGLLKSEDDYSYLSQNSKHLLNQIRYEAQYANIVDTPIVKASDNTFYIFPWVGTKAMNVLYLLFRTEGFNVTCLQFAFLPICLKIDGESDEKKIREVYNIAKTADIDINSFSLDEEKIDIGGKYNRYVESSLIKKEFLTDYLDVQDLQSNL